MIAFEKSILMCSTARNKIKFVNDNLPLSRSLFLMEIRNEPKMLSKNLLKPSRFSPLISENQERLYLLLIISVSSGVLLCLLIVVARWLFVRRKPSKDDSSEQGKAPGQFKSSNTGETTITNGFSADDISEIDADIDLTTPLPMSTGNSGNSITRNDVSHTLVWISCFYSRLVDVSPISRVLLFAQCMLSQKGCRCFHKTFSHSRGLRQVNDMPGLLMTAFAEIILSAFTHPVRFLEDKSSNANKVSHFLSIISELQHIHTITVALWQSGAIKPLAHILDAPHATVIGQQLVRQHRTTLVAERIDKSCLDYAAVVAQCSDHDNGIW
jgi:hypothetical protein